MEKHSVDIPETYLLFIAVHGNLGSGELGDFIKRWAQSECTKLGLTDKLNAERDQHLQELGKNLRNMLGDDAVDALEHDMSVAGKLLMSLLGSDKRNA